MGIKTKITKTSSIAGGNPTANDIRNYILNEYNNGTCPPSFVLLVGDANFVPVHYITPHPRHSNTLTGTDLYYFTLSGNIQNDYLPDVYGGRISVEIPSQLDVIVNKILTYEKNPPVHSNWFANILLAAYKQSGRYFIHTSGRIYNYTTPLGYNCNRQYENGYPPGSTSGCISAINDGVIIANHRDHGSSQNWGSSYTGWSHPKLTTGDISQLTNGDMLPVMFSINCQSGWFDGETDSYLGNYESLPEVFLRAPGKGVIGCVASTRTSWSGYNDELCAGFYDAIWPDFDPSYPTCSSTNSVPSPIYYMGAVLDYGKYWMYDKYILPGGCQPYPWTSSKPYNRISFENFHWHGDPAMSIWTAMPTTMSVTCKKIGSRMITVTVKDGNNPIKNALVCLQKTDLYLTGRTRLNGKVTLIIPSGTSKGTADITVTKHNFLPWESNIEIIKISKSNIYPPQHLLSLQETKYGLQTPFENKENEHTTYMKSVKKDTNQENRFNLDELGMFCGYVYAYMGGDPIPLAGAEIAIGSVDNIWVTDNEGYFETGYIWEPGTWEITINPPNGTEDLYLPLFQIADISG